MNKFLLIALCLSIALITTAQNVITHENYFVNWNFIDTKVSEVPVSSFKIIDWLNLNNKEINI